jgi:hypothetical protein
MVFYCLSLCHLIFYLEFPRAGSLCACGCESDPQCGRPALITAVVHHRTDCVRLLIDAGADMTIKDFVRVDFRLSLLLLSSVYFLLSSPSSVCMIFLRPYAR